MKKSSVGVFLFMCAILTAGYFAVSFNSGTSGPVSICSPVSAGGAYCVSAPAQTVYLVGIWMTMGMVMLNAVIRSIRHSLSSKPQA